MSEAIDYCKCGRIAERYCDFYSWPKDAKMPTEKNLKICNEPMCLECNNPFGEINGMLSPVSGDKAQLVNDTVDYCDKHAKVVRETGEIWERI